MLARVALQITLLLGLLAALLGYGAAAQAAGAAETAELPAEAIERLLHDLEDPERRQRLIEDLQALLAARQETLTATEPRGLGAELLSHGAARLQEFNEQLSEAGEGLLAVPELAAEALRQAQQPDTLRLWAEVVGKVVLVLLAGLLAERLVRRLLRRAHRGLADRRVEGLGLRALFLLARTLLDLVAVAAFALAAYTLLPLLEPRPVTQLTALALINANVLVRLILALARLLLVPGVPALRPLPLGEESAEYLYIWVRRLSGLTIYGYFILEAALLLGLAEALYGLLLRFLGLAVTATAVMLVLQNREPVAGWIRGWQRHAAGEPSVEQDLAAPPPGTAAAPAGLVRLPRIGALRQRLADFWHVLAILLLAGLFVTWALEIDGGFEFLLRAIALSIVAIGLTGLLLRALDRGIERLFRISAETKAAHPELEARANRYQPLVRLTLRAALYAVGLFAVLEAWGLGTLSWLLSAHGGVVVGELLTLLLIVAGALLLWEVSSALIEQSLAREVANGDRGSARKLTLLPLLRNAVRITIVVLATLVILSQLGVNIAPLLAGAGVIGLAVGFGAQTLVRDVITGAFILMEDAVAVGDWVEAGGHAGTVEHLTVRTMTMRDLDGTVHVVPFGDVTTVMNYNRAYGYAVIDAAVAYRESYPEVIQALQDVAAELRSDPDWGADVIDDLEVFGLNELTDSAVEIRVRLKTRPMRQWGVRRAFLERMKRIFDERDIEIPFPHRTIWFGVDKDGTAPPLRHAPIPPPRPQAPPPTHAPRAIRRSSEDEAGQAVLRERQQAEDELDRGAG